jgi:hypothetical protein
MQEFTEKNLISPQSRLRPVCTRDSINTGGFVGQGHRVHREEEKNRRRTLIPIFVNSVSLW